MPETNLVHTQAWYIVVTANPRDHSDMCHCEAAPYCLLWSLFINLAISKQPWAIPIKVGFSISWSVFCATQDLEPLVLIISTYSNERSKSDLACNHVDRLKEKISWFSRNATLFASLLFLHRKFIANLSASQLHPDSDHNCIPTLLHLDFLHRDFFSHRSFIANLFVSWLDRNPDYDSVITHENNIRLYEV